MTRIERAFAILKIVQSYDTTHGRPEKPAWGNGRIIETGYWRAKIHTPFNPVRGYEDWSKTEFSHFEGRVTYAPNSFHLWLTDGPKILNFGWVGEQGHIFVFNRGRWEHELFGLEPATLNPATVNDPPLYGRA